jgi:multidrug efflux pump subunit AcrA (membrane-fusion protein)
MSMSRTGALFVRFPFLVGALTGLTGLTGLGCASGVDVPLYEVRRQEFRREIVAEGTLRPVRSTIVSAPRTSTGALQIAWLTEDGIRVREGDVIARFDPTELEIQLLDGEIALSTTERKIDQRSVQTDATLAEVVRDRRLASLELEMARELAEKDPDIFSRVEIIEAEIDEELAQQKLDHADGREDTERRLSAAELEILDIEKRLASSKVARSREALSALEVRAPHDGIVLLERARDGNTIRVGDVTYGSRPIAEIPFLDEMEVEVYVLEADAGELAEGLSARVVVEGRSDRQFEASVRRVDRMPKARVRGVPVQYFAVVLALERTDSEIMKPGQRVSARLTLAELDDVLVVPRQAVQTEGPVSYVYRRNGGDFERSEVVVGSSSLGRIVVEEGLSAGDVIALYDPSHSFREMVPTPSAAEGRTATP